MYKLLVTIFLASCSLLANAQQTSPAVLVDSTSIGRLIRDLDIDAAQAQLKKDLATAKRKRQSTSLLEHQQQVCNAALTYLKGTDRVVILDSVVVDKSVFLLAYGFTAEAGKIWTDHPIVLTNTPVRSSLLNIMTTTYETERGNRQYRVAVSGDSVASLVLACQDKEGTVLMSPRRLNGLGIDATEVNFPFMMPDGTTFYFAARTNDGLGNYDLYVTRYDSESDRFYRAENMGFPYNSYANDYMLVIDEALGVGWFASDRYQPEGKVCVYTFIPNRSRHTIDFETVNSQQLRQWASLRPIRCTWTDDNESLRVAARQRLSLKTLDTSTKTHDFELVINDNFTYTSFDDFHHPEALELCRQWLQKANNLRTLQTNLDNLRTEYAGATLTRKKELSQQILHLERRVEELILEVHDAEKAVRNAELSN